LIRAILAHVGAAGRAGKVITLVCTGMWLSLRVICGAHDAPTELTAAMFVFFFNTYFMQFAIF